MASLTYRDVAEILAVIEASNCSELVFEFGDSKLVIRRHGSGGVPASDSASVVSGPAAPAPPSHAAGSPMQPLAVRDSELPDGAVAVRAPMVGTFYCRPSPSEPPFVEEGAKVAEGDSIGLIEVMKLYTTIAAPVTGTIMQVVAQDATLVEHEALLFVIQPD